MIRLFCTCSVILLLVSCAGEADDPGFDYADYDSASLESLCNNSFNVSPTEQPATFTAYGDFAVMRGLIGSDTPDAVADLLDEHPDVQTIVIAYSPGSEDDEANLEASLAIHDAGIDTCVPPDGEISSGGVDMFLSGNERWLADDSYVGVHSWGSDDGNGSDLADDDPEHQSYLDYYDAIGIDPEFYWFTLDAADADDMHNMTSAEREQYNIETQ